MLDAQDRQVLRQLGAQIHEVAMLPIQAEKRALFCAMNDLHMQRPMLTIDQEPWHELNYDGSLTCQVQDPFWRQIESDMRRTLFKWKHFPADMVVEDHVRIPMAIEDSGFGIGVEEKIAVTDEQSDVAGHAYLPQITGPEDICKIKKAVVRHNTMLTHRRMDAAHEIFDGIIPVQPRGDVPRLDMWDQLVERMGVEEVFYNLVDDPEFLLSAAERWIEVSLDRLDQYESLNLLDALRPTCHCAYTYNSTIPGPDFDPDKVTAADCWTDGMAQIFANVSPEMHEEFEFRCVQPFYQRFGLVNYGCCEPLDTKIDLVLRYIPNARKISVSPWAKTDIAAEHIGRSAVMCKKPNPAYVSAVGLCWEESERELLAALRAARQNHCAIEFVLKDISSVGYQPQRLFEWEKRAMALIQDFDV